MKINLIQFKLKAWFSMWVINFFPFFARGIYVYGYIEILHNLHYTFYMLCWAMLRHACMIDYRDSFLFSNMGKVNWGSVLNNEIRLD